MPPTITIFVTSRLSSWRTSSIMSPMSSSVAPDFLRTAIVTIPTAETSRNKLFPASSVADFASLMWGESVVLVVVVGMLMFSLSLRRSCCCSTTRATSCWLDHVNFSINVSRADVFSTKRATSTGNCRHVVHVQMPTMSLPSSPTHSG